MPTTTFLEMLSSQSYLKVRTANYSTNGYPARVATLTKPSGTGVISLGDGGAGAPPHVILMPFGTDASTHTGSLTVLLWRATNVNPGNPQMALWTATPLCSAQFTLSTSLPGVAGADVDNTQSFATTITMTGGPIFITSGAAPVSLDWFALVGTAVGHGILKVPTLGFRLMEVIFTTGGVVTDCNALWCYA